MGSIVEIDKSSRWIARLSNVTSLSELKAEFQSFVSDIGMDGGYVLNVSPTSKERIIDSRPDEWMERYSRLGYEVIDPITIRAIQDKRIFTWEEAFSSVNSDNHQLRVQQESSDFGLKNGVVLSIRDMPTIGSAACIYNENYSDFLNCMQEQKQLIEIVFHIVHEKLREFGCISETNLQLSAREAEVLSYAAIGKSNELIGNLLSISSSTVNTHIRSAGDKLGTYTKLHTIVKAVQLGLIAP